MVCALCRAKTRVINSRTQVRSNQVWRRRQCLACKAIFTTEETIEHGLHWLVKYPALSKPKPFSKNKLLLSLQKSCEHRSSSIDDATGLTQTVINKLAKEIDHSGTLEVEAIKNSALTALNRFDKAAAVHYQAFHS